MSARISKPKIKATSGSLPILVNSGLRESPILLGPGVVICYTGGLGSVGDD